MRGRKILFILVLLEFLLSCLEYSNFKLTSGFNALDVAILFVITAAACIILLLNVFRNK